MEFPLFETGSDTYISPINGSRCQGTRLLLLALKGLHSGALVQENSEGGYSAGEILQQDFIITSEDALADVEQKTDEF